MSISCHKIMEITDQVEEKQRQVDDVEVVDEAVVAEEANFPPNLGYLETGSQLFRKRVHDDGHGDDEGRQTPREERVPRTTSLKP